MDHFPSSFHTTTPTTNNNNSTTAVVRTTATKEKDDETCSQTSRMSINELLEETTSIPASPTSSSYYKMSVDSDDARSTSSLSIGGGGGGGKAARSEKIAQQQQRINQWTTTTTTTTTNIRPPPVETLYPPTSALPTTISYDIPFPKQKYDFRSTTTEKRSVNRQTSSLLPKSKALLRVMDQADQDTHLGDLEMKREHETTSQFNTKQQDVPAASWTKMTTDLSYQYSKLNPELEMTNFQIECITSNHKSIKRKISEDRFEPYNKRRAVSPSVISSPSPPANASARAKITATTTTSFNLHDACLSRMSLSE